MAPEDCGSGGRVPAFLARSSSNGEGPVRGVAMAAVAARACDGRRWRQGCDADGAVRGAGAETRQSLFDGQQAAGLHEPHQADLQVEAGLQRGLQILEEIERELQVAGQVLFGETARRCRASFSRCAALAATRRVSAPAMRVTSRLRK